MSTERTMNIKLTKKWNRTAY